MTAAATCPVGLGQDEDGLMTGTEESVERCHRKLRRAEEHDTKPARHHWPARVNFLIRRTMRSFLIPRSRSTNSVPSR